MSQEQQETDLNENSWLPLSILPTLSRNIIKLRLDFKLKPYEVAEQLNWDLLYYISLESGKVCPTSYFQLKILADLFKISPEDLLEIDDYPIPQIAYSQLEDQCIPYTPCLSAS